MNKDQRGLRFNFSAEAEVRVGDSAENSPGRVTELSFRGCFVEVSGSFSEHQRLRIKIFHANEYFETPADVIYIRPSGVGVLFAETNPHFRSILQKWILMALDQQPEQVPAI